MSLLRLAHNPPVSISQDSTVMDAIRLMTDHRIGAVAVTGGDGRVTGIFTERDVMKKIVLPGLDAAATPLSKVMTTDVKTAPSTIPVSDAVDILRENQIRHLVILDASGRLEGVVSLRHLLYDIMDVLESRLDGLESYLAYDGPGG